MKQNVFSFRTLILSLLTLLFTQVGWGQISMSATGSNTQNFNGLGTSSGTWTDNSTISSWYAQRTGSGTSITISTGSTTAGDLYNFGSTSATDRALGSIGSGNAAAGSFAWGVLLRNTSGATITNITVSYTGEQWRRENVTAQTVSFWYKTSSSAISSLNPGATNTGWTAVTALDFASPQNSSTAGALDGNLAANRTVISATAIPSLSLANNDYIMLRWSDIDHTGSDHGLSIDDVTISWTVPSYTVTFNSNGGSGSMSNQSASAATNLTSNTFTRTGYTFAGWNIAADGTGTSYTDGASFPFTANTTLYAQWTAKTYTVTFDGNGGGTPSPASKSVTYASTYGTLATVSRSGYTLSGWNTSADGTGTTITASSTVSITANQTLYAQWTANTLTVTYDSQGGSSISSGSTTTGGSIANSPGTPTRSGYSFNGWFVASSGGTAITFPYTHGQTADFFLYAQWSVTPPLPVSLLSFSGYKDGVRNQLRWVTATETNNSGFQVERSSDGLTYQPIGFVQTLAIGGNSQSQLKYSFTDLTPGGIKQYYRLKQMDIDGISSLSNILLIQGEKPTGFEIASVFPNPTKGQVTLLLSAPTSEVVNIRLVDLAGRIVETRQVAVLPGNNSIPFDLSKQAKGQYLIQVGEKTVRVVRE